MKNEPEPYKPDPAQRVVLTPPAKSAIDEIREALNSGAGHFTMPSVMARTFRAALARLDELTAEAEERGRLAERADNEAGLEADADAAYVSAHSANRGLFSGLSVAADRVGDGKYVGAAERAKGGADPSPDDAEHAISKKGKTRK